MPLRSGRINPRCGGCQGLLKQLADRDSLIAGLREQLVTRIHRIAELGQRLAAAQADRRVVELEQQLEQERSRGEQLQQQVAALKTQLDQAQRAVHAQAAPFRVRPEKRKAEPGKPGRKKGHPGAFRPRPEGVEEEATVPLECCPQCGGPVEDLRPVTQVIEDLEMRVRRLRLTTHTGRCARCGPVRSTHPAQVSVASGAAGTQVGARALGLAAYLNQHLHLPTRKTCAVLEQLGLRLTPGGLTQALARMADRLEAAWRQLQEALRTSPVVHADETGWWLGGVSAWLWVFATPDLTCYRIGNRSQEMIRHVLGDDFPGVLVSDCLSSYDPHPGRKSKCCAHHLKAIREALQRTPQSGYLQELKRFWETALELHRQRPEREPDDHTESLLGLHRWLDRLLAEPRAEPDEERLANRFRKQRRHLLTFLHETGVDPTNNLAERQLRPAVIARKLSCGNKTGRGRQTFEVLASLAATCRQRGAQFADLVALAATLARPPPPLPQPP